jgi:hypothetical protein
MANILTANPWVVDTASATPIFTTYAKIRHMEFADYSTDTDSVLVTDKNGVRIFSQNGAADLQNVRSGNIGWANGVVVSQLTAGARVYIYWD